MANKIGPAIKEARTNAGLSQTALAEYVDNVSAADISKAERGEKELTQTALKQIAKATGVTQKSLLDAAAASTYTSTAKKSSSSSSTKKSTSSSKKTTSSSKKTTSSSTTSVKLTATEKKLVELYRDADSDTKKQVLSLLKGESSSSESVLGNIMSNILSNLGSN